MHDTVFNLRNSCLFCDQKCDHLGGGAGGFPITNVGRNIGIPTCCSEDVLLFSKMTNWRLIHPQKPEHNRKFIVSIYLFFIYLFIRLSIYYLFYKIQRLIFILLISRRVRYSIPLLYMIIQALWRLCQSFCWKKFYFLVLKMVFTRVLHEQRCFCRIGRKKHFMPIYSSVSSGFG